MAVDSGRSDLRVTSADTINFDNITYSASSSSTNVFGIYANYGEAATESWLNIGTFGSGATVNASTTANDAYSVGLYATDMSITTLAGTVSATAVNANQAFALYATDDDDGANISIGTLSGTVTATGTNAGASGIWTTGDDGEGVVNITTLSGTVSATAFNASASGIYSNYTNIATLSGTVSATASGTVTTSRNVYVNGVDSSDGIYLLTYESGATAYGLGGASGSMTIGALTGTVTATSANGPAYGMQVNYGPITVGTLSGSVTATSLGGTTTIADSYGSTTINSPAYALYADGIGINTLSGTVSASSAGGSAYGLYSIGTLNGGDTDTAMLISGMVKAAGATDTYALYAEGAANVYITGTVKATSTGGTAYAIKTGSSDDSVTLGTGASLTGAVDLGDGADTLTLVGTGTASTTFSNIETLAVGDGSTLTDWVWATSATVDALNVNSGSSLSVSNGVTIGSGTITVASGGTLNLAAYGQSTAGVTATTATINGTLGVDASAGAIGTTSQVLSATTLTTASVVSANPNFTVTRTDSDASGTVTVTTSFSPQNDESSLSATSSLASAQAFANVAQTRSLAMLADSGQDSDDPIMVASSGSLAGLLDPRKPETTWGMYLQPVFSMGSRDGDSEGYDSSMYGLEVGIDRKYGENWVFGVMGGIGSGTIDFNGSAFVDNDSEDQKLYTAGLYGGYKFADWTFADTLSATYATHDSSRNAGLSETAKADYDSWLTANQFTAIYHWQPAEHWEIAPRAGLNITHLHRAGFSETGATNAVSYDDLDKTFADGTLGVRVKYDTQVEDSHITPYAGLAVIHAMGSGDITVRQYLSTTSAQVTTQNDSNRLNPELGVTFSKGNTAFTMGYTGEYSDTTKSNSIFGMLRMDF